MRGHQIHIPRTGGSQLRAALAGTTYAYHDHNFRMADVPRGHRVVVSLRDPVERWGSLYALAQQRNVQRSGRLLDPEEWGIDVGRAAALLKENWGSLFKPQVWWVHSAEALRARGAIVLRTETLTDDAQRLLGIRVDPQGPLRHPELSEGVLRALRAYYAEDIALLAELGAE